MTTPTPLDQMPARAPRRYEIVAQVYEQIEKRLAEGYSVAEVAERLGMNPRTLGAYVRQIRRTRKLIEELRAAGAAAA
jgi:DNA-binding CsgD family transcriptional regulator